MEHILLIEDNLSDIELIQSYLRDASLTHRLHKTKSLQEGLEIIRYNPIDIVLLDLALDDTAGFNTLRTFLQEVPNVPVIILTGTSSEVLGMQLVRAGAQDFLVKGNFDSKQLTRAIRHSTKRFKAQVALREELWKTQRQAKQYQLLHELVNLGSWELDLLDNTMQWSKEMFQILGYHPNSFEPKLSDYLRIVHRDDQERVKLFFQEAMRQSKSAQIEHRAVINNRSIRHFSLKAQVISEEPSGRVLLMGALQDISEFNSAEKNGMAVLPLQTNVLENQFKLTSRLRQSLEQLMQHFKSMEIGLALKHPENFKASREIISRMVELVYEQKNRLVIVSPTLPVQKQMMDLSAWKHWMGALLETKALNGNEAPLIQFETQLPTQIITDESLLTLLFLNLIQSNTSAKEEKETPRLSFKLEKKEDESLQLHLILHASTLPLSQSRRKKWIEHLEERLQHNTISKTEEKAELSLVALAKLIPALNVTFKVSKNQDIHLFVPVEAPHANGNLPKGDLKMLIVEHQTIVQIALKRILQAGIPQISLDFAEDLSKGVQSLSEKEYDLVLADIQLPTVEPTQVISALKETKDVALMALASNFSKEEKNSLRNLGVNDFVIKPPQREALLQSVRNLLNH